MMNFADFLYKLIPRDKKTGGGNGQNQQNTYDDANGDTENDSNDSKNICLNKLGLFKLSAKKYTTAERKNDGGKKTAI